MNSGTYGDVPVDIVSISASVGTIIDNGDGTSMVVRVGRRTGESPNRDDHGDR